MYSKFVWSKFGLIGQMPKLARKCLMTGCYHKPCNRVCTYLVFVHNILNLFLTVPSCYVTTGCTGEPINSSITFADCCTIFGASYDLDGQCQPCQSTS